MADGSTETIAYFTCPPNTYWQWADGMEVIEWGHGSSICYRNDLNQMLWQMSDNGLPSLQLLLLVLAATKEQLTANNRVMNTLTQIEDDTYFSVNPEQQAELAATKDKQWPKIRHLFDVIYALPTHLKQGNNRVALINEVCRTAPKALSRKLAKLAAHYLDAGVFDYAYAQGRHLLNYGSWQSILASLTTAAGRYENAEQLANAIETGHTRLPQPVEPALPEGTGDDTLLDALLQDPLTVGMARLTEHLVAALNIPMHTSSSGELPLGGVSDITNRGSFDRLLLSELAHDHDTLTARLVHREALYLRREEPPRPQNKTRVILLDTTLTLWGMPRPFGVACALACTLNSRQHPSGHNHISAYMLNGTEAMPFDIGNKAGVIGAMQAVNTDLHCGQALENWCRQTKTATHNSTETTLITEEGNLQRLAFQPFLTAAKTYLNYLITVGRQGRMQLYQYTNGNLRLVNKAAFDLKAHLLNTKTAPKPPLELPTFYRQLPWPLLLPAINIEVNPEYAHLTDKQALCISQTQRLLLWPERGKGAIEVVANLPHFNYYHGHHHDTFLLLTIDPTTFECKLFRINQSSGQHQALTFTTRLTGADKVRFANGTFYIKHDSTIWHIGPHAETLTKTTIGAIEPTVEDLFTRPSSHYKHFLYKPVRRFINNGYTVLLRFDKIHINQYDLLSVDYRQLVPYEGNDQLIWEKNAGRPEQYIATTLEDGRYHTAVENAEIKMRPFSWPCGSKAMADGRGLLHLRSHNPNVTDVTIVLALDKPTAAWAADGTTCGSPYFLPNTAKSIKVIEFYGKYIMPIIQAITL